MKKLLTVVAATAMLSTGAFATSYFVADYSFPGVPCFPGVSFGWSFTAEGADGLTVWDVLAADIGGMMQYEVIFSGVGTINMQLDNCDQGTEGAAFSCSGVPDDGFGHYYPEGVAEMVTTFCDFCGPVTEVVLPTEFALANAYPNPFNPTTTIDYSIADPCYVTLTVFNVAGQEVATLVDGELERGFYDVTFDAADLASGVYFYKLNAGDFSAIKKMTLIK